MGDVLLTTPIIRRLKNQLSAEISFLVKSEYEQLLAENPYVYKLYKWSKNENVKLLNALKNEKFDYIIDLQNSIRSIKIRRQLSGKLLSLNKKNIQKWSLTLFGHNTYSGVHIVEDYMQAVAPLHITDDGVGLDFHIDEINLNENIQPEKKRIIIVAGGSYVTKRIPYQLIKDLIKEDKYNYVLIGGQDVEREVANISQENVVNHIGQLSIKESALQIMQSDLVITGDTGMMHITAALQKPIIVIWGSTAPEIGFYPYYGSNSTQRFISIQNSQLSCHPCSKYGRPTCPKGHLECLNKISSEEVHQSIYSLLG